MIVYGIIKMNYEEFNQILEQADKTGVLDYEYVLKTTDPAEVISFVKDNPEKYTIEEYTGNDDMELVEGSDFDTPENFINRFSSWFAVMKDRDDTDWGTGSFDLAKAKQMAKDMGEDAYIAVIENGVCVEEIEQEDF